MVAIFPKLCLWRRSLCSHLRGIDPEKLYRATLSLCREMKADIQQVRIVSLFRFVVVVFLLAASDCETP